MKKGVYTKMENIWKRNVISTETDNVSKKDKKKIQNEVTRIIIDDVVGDLIDVMRDIAHNSPKVAGNKNE